MTCEVLRASQGRRGADIRFAASRDAACGGLTTMGSTGQAPAGCLACLGGPGSMPGTTVLQALLLLLLLLLQALLLLLLKDGCCC